MLNQHSVTEYWAGFNSSYLGTSLFPYEVAVAGIDGAQFYQKVETGYNPQAEINSRAAGTCLRGLWDSAAHGEKLTVRERTSGRPHATSASGRRSPGSGLKSKN
jgi:hypothetical protein